MSIHLVSSQEKKLALTITCIISVLIVGFLCLYKIMLPPAPPAEVKTESTIDLPGVFEAPTTSSGNAENQSSLSSKLPAGISQSILKMETEMFTNSFLPSFSQNTTLKSNYLKEPDTEMPGREPDRTIGKNTNKPDLMNETNFLGGNLKNRKLLFIGKVKGTNEEGCVVIKLSVKPEGDVSIAEIDPERTTTLSSSLRSKALKTSLGAIFEPTGSREVQSGFITFKFEY